MSDSAPSTWKVVPSTRKFGITNKALQARLSVVTTALMEKQPISKKKDDDWDIKTWQVEFLAEGGYNDVWLVSYTLNYQVCDHVANRV